MAYIYDPDNKFGYKDTLPPESDEKVIRGTDFDAEFKRIETGVGDSFSETNEGLEQEINDRIAGDQNLQDQINNLDNSEILGDLNAEIQARIEGDQNLQDQIDDLLAQPGAGMVISETEPTEEERVPGLQWLDSTTAEVWIWDGERWLEFPSTEGPAGPAGADGDAYWEQNGNDIYYSDGSVGIGTDDPKSLLSLEGANPRIDLTDNDIDASHRINAASSVGNLSIDVDIADNQADPSFIVNMKGQPALAINKDRNATFSANVTADTMRLERGTYPFMELQQTGSSSVGQLAMSGNELQLRQTGNHPLILLTDNQARLTISGLGDAEFSGSVTADSVTTEAGGVNVGTWGIWRAASHHCGVGFYGSSSADTALFPLNNDGGPVDGTVSLGSRNYKFKDAHFSGSITLNTIGNPIKLYAPEPDKYTIGTQQNGNIKYTSYNRHAFEIEATQAAQDEPTIYAVGNIVSTGTVNGTRVVQDGAPVIDAKGLITTLSTLRNATKDETTLEGLRDSIGNAIGGLIEKFEAEIATMEIPE